MKVTNGKVDFNQEKIVKLLVGERFYGDRSAALREAILNGIDACTRKAEADPEYKQSLKVVFQKTERLLIVTDNGIGMDLESAQKYFLSVGSSLADINPADSNNANIVGEFGIGVLSYFLVSEKVEVKSKMEGKSGIRFILEKKHLAGNSDVSIEEIDDCPLGTTIKIFIDEDAFLEELIDKYPYWIRNVQGISAKVLPENQNLAQGDANEKIDEISLPIDPPNEIQEFHLGVPSDLDHWVSPYSYGKVNLLYKGVFVEPYKVPNLWGLEGSIYVNPKSFKPKLNREGFVNDGLKQVINPLLIDAHPTVLIKVLEKIREKLDSNKSGSEFDEYGSINLWFAIPRNPQYSVANQVWDEYFLNRKTFARLLPNEERVDLSLNELKVLASNNVYLVGPNLASERSLIKQAVKVLVADKQNAVIQGKERRKNYWKEEPSFVANNTTDMLLGYFKEFLPSVSRLNDTIATEIVSKDTLEDIFDSPIKISLIRMGSESEAVIRISNKVLWINIDNSAGKEIAIETINNNQGYLGLLMAVFKHSPDDSKDLIPLLINKTEPKRLGPVAKQHLKSKI